MPSRSWVAIQRRIGVESGLYPSDQPYGLAGVQVPAPLAGRGNPHEKRHRADRRAYGKHGMSRRGAPVVIVRKDKRVPHKIMHGLAFGPIDGDEPGSSMLSESPLVKRPAAGPIRNREAQRRPWA